MERRKLLAVLGGSASFGLAGCLGGGGGDDNGGDNNTTDDGSTGNGEGNGTEAEANFTVDFSVAGSLQAGEQAVVEWTAENTGEAEGTQTVAFSVGGSEQDSTEVTLAGGGSESGEFTFTPSSDDAGDLSIGVSTGDDEAEETVTVEALAEANFQVSLGSLSGVTVGTDLGVPYTVENTGDTEATQSVVFSVAGSQEGSTELTLGGGASESGEFSYSPAEADVGDLSVSVATGDDEASGTVEIVEGGAEALEPTGPVLAESQGGLLAIGQDSEESAESEGFALPPSETIQKPITLEGNISEDGSWESTAIEFPPVPPSEFFPLDEVPIDDAAVEIGAPEGITGQIDYEAETMTFNGTLVVSVFIDSGSGLPDEPDFTVDIALSGTSGVSNELEGSFDNDPPTFEVTIVDNQSEIPALDPETSDVSPIIAQVVNDTLGLPSAAGETWLIIDFAIESST